MAWSGIVAGAGGGSVRLPPGNSVVGLTGAGGSAGAGDGATAGVAAGASLAGAAASAAAVVGGFAGGSNTVGAKGVSTGVG